MKILSIAVLLLAFYLIIFGAYRKIVSGENKNNDSLEILNEIKSNNTFLPMLDVFTCLNEELSECGTELHADLRGYLKHGKAK